VSIISCGERMPLTYLSYYFSCGARAPNNLTPHSAEVNIGIAAACIPTLLPLYRLLRDKYIATHHTFKLNIASSHKPSFRLRKAKNSFSNPHRPEWWHVDPQASIEIERQGQDAIEMKPKLPPRPKYKHRETFLNVEDMK